MHMLAAERIVVMSLSRLDARDAVLRAKTRSGKSWQEIADAVGRSLVWTTSALLGQQPLDASQVRVVADLLGLDADVAEALALPPVRGAQAVDVSEPLVYRLQEIVQVYGPTLAQLIGEEFGDGIMSAIDFELEMERVPDPKGDRVRLILNGKFLPYRVW
jgi:cyanate lyase